MSPSAAPTPVRHNSPTLALLSAERQETERLVNRVRAGVLGVLAVAAVVYAQRLPLALTVVNFGVLLPMLAWTAVQELLLHRRGRSAPVLPTLNAAVDITAVTLLLLGYGTVGTPELAVASPIWLAYFVILAARPFAGSPAHAATATAVAVTEYAALVAYLGLAAGLELHHDPIRAATLGGTSLFDEGAKLLLLGVAGLVTAYASSWYERTLTRAAVAVRASESERLGLAEELAHRAFHDPLTDLANRTLFHDRVGHALERSRRTGGRVAVLLLDLDAFKKVNDTIGHVQGDELLRTVAHRLLAATRGTDTVARLGGDEFAVLLQDIRSDEEITVVADRIAAALARPVDLAMKPVCIGASMGVATTCDASDTEELLRNADVALREAKQGRRGSHVVFSADAHAPVLVRLALEADLPGVLERNELTLMYQPMVELATGEMAGVEALLRWAHPRRGLVQPSEFIPIAEETGLIVQIGRWVLHEACRQGATWNRSRRGEGLTISVNISAHQLAAHDLAADVASALDASGLEPRSLLLEITESVLLRDEECTLERLRQLKALGVRLAIDDFGTGYSSLGQLRRFPMDILKVDKAFIDGLAAGEKGLALTRAVFALGESLGLRCIAEGVEKPAQHATLRRLGCSLAQGFLFARPLTPPQIDALLASRTENALI